MMPSLRHRDFRDAIVDSLIHTVDTPDPQHLKYYPTSITIRSAYIAIPRRSPLRKLLIHMHFFRGLPKWFNKQSNIDFLRDLAGNFLQDRSHFFTRTDHTAAQLAACSYHCYAPENLSYNGSQ